MLMHQLFRTLTLSLYSTLCVHLCNVKKLQDFSISDIKKAQLRGNGEPDSGVSSYNAPASGDTKAIQISAF
jgi:hypothetical protein